MHTLDITSIRILYSLETAISTAPNRHATIAESSAGCALTANGSPICHRRADPERGGIDWGRTRGLSSHSRGGAGGAIWGQSELATSCSSSSSSGPEGLLLGERQGLESGERLPRHVTCVDCKKSKTMKNGGVGNAYSCTRGCGGPRAVQAAIVAATFPVHAY